MRDALDFSDARPDPQEMADLGLDALGYVGRSRPDQAYLDALAAHGVRFTFIFETDPNRSQQGYQAGVYDAQFFEQRVNERGYAATMPAMVVVSDGSAGNPDYGADQIAEYGRGWADTITRPLCGYGNRYCVDAFNRGVPSARLVVADGGWLPIPWGGTPDRDAAGQDANTPPPIGGTDLNRVWVDWHGDAPPPPSPSVRMPFDGDYPVTSPYGPRAGGFHYGIDFGCPVGTPMIAVADGTVIFAAFEEAGGNHLAIDLDDPALPNKAGYMHLESFAVGAGARVRAGDVVGYSDTTGAAVTGPHLHFWMGDNANVGAVDPSPYLWPPAPAPPVVGQSKEPPDMWIAYMDDSGWCDLWHPAGVIVDSFDSHQPNPNGLGVGETLLRYLNNGVPLTHFPDGAAGGPYDVVRGRMEASWKAGGGS